MYTGFNPIKKLQFLFPLKLKYSKFSIGSDSNFFIMTIGKWLQANPKFI